MCLAAAVLISKVIHSSYGQYLEEGMGKAAFSTCISIFKECSVEDNNMEGRATRILSQLWAIHKDLFEASPEAPPRLSVRSRSFFSIVHDGLWQWRERYAGIPSNGAPSIPPPLISPVSMDAAGQTTNADGPEMLPPVNVAVANSADVGGQSGDGFANTDAEYQEDHRGLPSSYQFSISDPAQNSWDTIYQQGDALVGIGLGVLDTTQFDLLFPDHNISTAV